MLKLTLIIFIYVTFLSVSTAQENEFIPQWAKKAVWYQIFPERFRNGDINNDPTVKSIEGSWPYDYKSPWQVNPWGSDWYKMQPWEKATGKDIWYNMQRRRYGGDIQGIIDKLDYLQDLGITAVYINPVFQAPSLHKYDGATYHHIDPDFGPDPEGDRKLIESEIPGDPSTWVWTSADKLFLRLVNEVHNRKIKIIIDGVFNHMGVTSWPFRDVVKNQQDSEYRDWFIIHSWDDPAKGTKFDYKAWFGAKDLPELWEDENGIVDGPKEYIYNITRRWMNPDNDNDPSDGIDGWRLDVAFCVKHRFWKDWRKYVKSINPEAYITAEVNDSLEVVREYVHEDEFDAVMNYNFTFACSEFFIDEKTGVTPSGFDSLLRELREAFPGNSEYVQQNLDNSHDTQRLLSHIVNRDKYKMRDWSNTGKFKAVNPDYDTRKPEQDEIQINKLMAIFKFTYVGAPYIYYGEEVGMWGANDPDCRKPMIWDDIEYEDERYLPDQSLKPSVDKVKQDKNLFKHYQALINIRNENEVLQTGEVKTILADDENNIYAFSRFNSEDEIIIVLNNNTSAITTEIRIANPGQYKKLFGKGNLKAGGNKIRADIPAKDGIIFRNEHRK